MTKAPIQIKATSGFQKIRALTTPLAGDIGDAHIDLAKAKRRNSCLRPIHAAGRIEARRGLDRGDDLTFGADDRAPNEFGIIRAVARHDAFEGEFVRTDRNRFARLQRDDLFGAPAGRGKAEQGDADARMGEGRAERMARHAARALARNGSGNAAAKETPAEIGERAHDHIERDPDRITLSAGPPRHAARTAMNTRAAAKATASLCATPARSPRFQASIWPNGIRMKQRNEQRHEGQIEERRARPRFFLPSAASSASG